MNNAVHRTPGATAVIAVTAVICLTVIHCSKKQEDGPVLRRHIVYPVNGRTSLAERISVLERTLAAAPEGEKETLKKEHTLSRTILDAVTRIRALNGRWPGHEELDMGSTWLQGEFSTVYEETRDFPRADDLSVLPPLKRMFNPSEAPRPESLKKTVLFEKPGYVGTYDQWIGLAINVPPRSWPGGFRKNVLDREDFTGLNLTHQLFVLHLVRRCWPEEGQNEELSRVRDRTARAIAVELAREKAFSDLNAERLAFLAAEGYFTLIEPRWSDIVIRSRTDGGLWRDRGERSDNPHTTFLALWYLISTQQDMVRFGEKKRKVPAPGKKN